jgi:pimeloyl-ACP methyl ester carboxylesterase
MMKWYASSVANSTIPYESITVPTRYGKTHLLAAGPADAPPVVLLHGMEGTALSWKPQAAALHTAFRLYALDIIGSCGKSAPVRLSYENGEYGEWLADVVTGLGLERASFAGVSNGSWMVMKLAAHAPERIEKAVLMSVNGLVPVRFPFRLARHVEKEAVRGLVGGVSGRVVTRDTVRLAASLFMRSRGARPDPDDLEWFFLLLRHYRYRFPPGPVGDDELRMLAAPTLVMMGERERFFDVHAAIGRARGLLPDLRAGEIIPGVGHNMATDNPALINARLVRFLQHAE